jgi:undecaprenyl-diphosphatase
MPLAQQNLARECNNGHTDMLIPSLVPRVLVYTAIVCAGAFTALSIAVLLSGEPGLPGELALARTWSGLRTPWLTQLIQLITFATSALPALVICGVCTLFWLKRQRTLTALWPLLAYFGHLGSNIVTRIAFGRLRPDLEYIPHQLPEIQADFQRFSFPSGHAGASVIAYGVLLITLWRVPALRLPAALLAVIMIAGTGFGRVYLGVHWPTDVLAGWALSASWLMLGLVIKVRSQQTCARIHAP